MRFAEDGETGFGDGGVQPHEAVYNQRIMPSKVMPVLIETVPEEHAAVANDAVTGEELHRRWARQFSG